MDLSKLPRPGQASDQPDWMEEMPPNALDFPHLHAGDIVEGTVISVSSSEILVDIGYKSDAVVDSRELERLDPEVMARLSVDASILAYVLQPEDKDGNVVISLARAQQEQDWRRLEELLQSQDAFEGLVTACNRGGVIVQLGRIRGFVPASQLSPHFQAQQALSDDSVERWAPLIGQKMWLKVVELDRERSRLILSERAAARDRRSGQKSRLLTELKEGTVATGVVTGLAPFGAFVDLGGADGLIHLSELSWHRIDHPSEVLHVGQQIQVYVMNVDAERKRIGLSLRRLAPEPWSTVEQRYLVGQVVEATITRLTSFGAFAQIEQGIEGLIHITEMADYRISHPKEIVHEGDEVRVRIIRIDPERRRVALSLRQVSDEAYVEVDWRDEAGVPQPQDEEPVSVIGSLLARPSPDA